MEEEDTSKGTSETPLSEGEKDVVSVGQTVNTETQQMRHVLILVHGNNGLGIDWAFVQSRLFAVTKDFLVVCSPSPPFPRSIVPPAICRWFHTKMKSARTRGLQPALGVWQRRLDPTKFGAHPLNTCAFTQINSFLERELKKDEIVKFSILGHSLGGIYARACLPAVFGKFGKQIIPIVRLSPRNFFVFDFAFA